MIAFFFTKLNMEFKKILSNKQKTMNTFKKMQLNMFS